MKICIVTDIYRPFPGGVAEHAYNLCHALRKLGHDVKVLTSLFDKKVKNFPEVYPVGRCLKIKSNATIVTFGGIHPATPFLVSRFFKHHSFDIVHIEGPAMGFNMGYWALVTSPYPCVASIHTVYYGYNYYSLARFLFSGTFKKLKAVLPVSESAKKEIEKYFKANYKIIPNGIDIEKFNPNVKPHPKMSGDFKKILYVGRLEERKGLEYLLRAFPLIKKEIKDAKLFVVGKGHLEDYFKKLASKFGSDVEFVGYVPFEELPSFYAGCDVYCSPATGGEAFGIVLLEAMATGKPVCASRIEGYSEVIKDGENGLLFEPKNPQDIADKIIKILKDENLRKKLIENGLKFARNLSWENIAKKHLEIYEDVIKGRV